ncbi:hypothetical protein QTP86_028616, partial [Hemibagrus guttatus]
TAVDNQPIRKGDITRQTIPLTLQVGLLHFEELSFFVISSPANPIILGFPWLQLCNTHMSWREGELTRWSPYCQNHYLKSSCFATSIESPINAKSTTLPREYHDLQEVVSKERATQLAPNHPWDCVIDLLPNAMLPKSKVYPLSLSESKAMEDYIEEALATGYIQPSTSLAAAGFFFIEKKNGGLWPCIDYQGLNNLTMRYPYPLPIVLVALEQLREAQVSGNLGIRCTITLIRNKFWWPSLSQDMEEYVEVCATCAQSRMRHQLPMGLLEPLPIPQRPWSHMVVDFITGLPDSEGYNTILVAINRFSKAC